MLPSPDPPPTGDEDTTMNRRFFHLCTFILAALLLLSPLSPAWAVDYEWNNLGTGNWEGSGNWIPSDPPGFPQSGDNAWINNGGTAQIIDIGTTAANLYLGGVETGTLELISRTFGVSTSLNVGSEGSGLLDLGTPGQVWLGTG